MLRQEQSGSYYNCKHPPTTTVWAADAYHPVWMWLIHSLQIWKSAATFVKLYNNGGGFPFTKVKFTASESARQSSQPPAAVRASWLQFWLSRWDLFWSGSSPHLSECQGEGMSACVQWSSGKLPSPAPRSESCASFYSPEKGSSPHSSPATESSASQPGVNRHEIQDIM